MRSRKKKNVDQEYALFVEMMRITTLNISAYDLCMASSKYAKFFKTMLSTKKESHTNDLVTISVRCSSLLKKDIQLSRKLKDPGSCDILCTFRDKGTFKALCDLGSRVSLMPKKIAKKLNIASEIKYTPVKLLLADRSMVKPQGVIENVCVDIREVILPCDFFIIDIEVDDKVPLILGRPFFTTGDAWIGVKDKIVVFQVNGEPVRTQES